MARTYREAGVDREEAARAVERIAEAAASTATPAVLGGVGGFGALFRFDPSTYPDPVLVSSTDGVGTKLKVALALGRHDTIGIDLVNACVNDIVVSGADPLFFLDYLAVGELHADVVEAIVAGVAAGCAAAGIPLVGGETAQMPDLYRDDDYDLAGFVVGVVARADIIDGSAVRSGDVLLGLPSSGLHTNGYTLARRVLPETIWARADAGRPAARSARRCSSRIGPTSTRSASCDGRCERPRPTSVRWLTSPAAAGRATCRARSRTASGSRSRRDPGRCRRSSASSSSVATSPTTRWCGPSTSASA